MSCLTLCIFLCVLLYPPLASAVLAANCREAKKSLPMSGPRTLNINGQDVNAYCDQSTDGGGWTVIQRRENGRTDFYRDWDDYVRGFGDPRSEYWLGLKYIHHLTNNLTNELRVDLWDFEDNTAFARYGQFRIEGESDNYRLRVGNFSRYSTAGDSLDWQNNMPFTTKDRDNDYDRKNNCAQSYHGAWWYFSCHWSNLNGRYKTSPELGWDGVVWYYWQKKQVSLKKTEMKIRPL